MLSKSDETNHLKACRLAAKLDALPLDSILVLFHGVLWLKLSPTRYIKFTDYIKRSGRYDA